MLAAPLAVPFRVILSASPSLSALEHRFGCSSLLAAPLDVLREEVRGARAGCERLLRLALHARHIFTFRLLLLLHFSLA